MDNPLRFDGIRYDFGFVVPPRDWTCDLHGHDGILELVWHPQGRGATTLADGTELAFGPGQLVWYPPGVPHRQRFSRLGPDLCVQLAIAGPAPTPFDRAGVARIDDPRLRAELVALAAPQRSSPLALAALDHRAAALLADLADLVAPAAAMEPRDAAGRAMALIRDRAHRLAGIEEVARAVGLGPDRLRHVFTARWGVPPLRALTTARLERARELLRRTPLPLEAVARECGYANARYFCTVFRRTVGCTPGVWRTRSS